ncbi:SRPBCC family protein [Kibdelosporangium lantanae]
MTYEPTPLADVEARPTGSRWTLVFHRDLRHPPTKVWAALTRPDQLSKWAPYTADRDLGTAGSAVLAMIDGMSHEEIKAEVTHAEPIKLLEYSWGTDLLRWELEETPAGTLLTLSHTVRDKDFVPKVAAGWHLCLDVAEKLLDGTPIDPIRGGDAVNHGWTELNAGYAAKLDIPDTGLPGHVSE